LTVLLRAVVTEESFGQRGSWGRRVGARRIETAYDTNEPDGSAGLWGTAHSAVTSATARAAGPDALPKCGEAAIIRPPHRCGSSAVWSHRTSHQSPWYGAGGARQVIDRARTAVVRADITST
jgi:hypothetical protein